MAVLFNYFTAFFIIGLVACEDSVPLPPVQATAIARANAVSISQSKPLGAEAQDTPLPHVPDPDPALCKGVEGFKCTSSCSLLVRCYQSSNTTNNLHIVRRCEGKITTMCNLSSLDCSASICEDDDLPNQLSNCYEDGVYPNPRKCRSYFECKNKTRTDFTCSPNTIYNPRTQNCSQAYDSELCSKSVIPFCSSVKDIGAYSRDPNIFYVCAYNTKGYLIPELRKCNAGFEFDNDESKCIPSGASTISINLSILLIVATFTVFKEFK